MNEHWLDLLRAEVARTNQTQAARRIGISRPAVCQLVNGTYPARDLEPVKAKVLAALAVVRCPHQGLDLATETCRSLREAAMPTGSRIAYRQWVACRGCPHNRIGEERHDQH